jgi:hypothetical protein
VEGILWCPGQDLRGLVVRPGHDLPRRHTRPCQDLLGFVGRARADLLRLLPRLLTVLSRAPVQKAAPLYGLVEKGPPIVKERLISSTCPGDLVLEGVGHGIAHPRPHVVSVGVRVHGNPQGPP